MFVYIYLQCAICGSYERRISDEKICTDHGNAFIGGSGRYTLYEKMLTDSMLLLYALVTLLILRICLKPVRQQFPSHKMAAQVIFSALFLTASLLPVIGAFAKPASLAAPLRRIGNFWLGFALFVLLGAVLCRILALVFRKYLSKAPARPGIPWRRAAALCAAAVLIVSLGTLHTGQIRTTSYTIPVTGTEQQKMRIAFVADLHIGCYIGNEQITKMVDKINEMDPDLVLFGGDIYDSDYNMLNDPEEIAATLRKIHSRYGVYGVYGNHDVAETLIGGFSISPASQAYRDPRMAELLKESNITMLDDETVSLAGGKIKLVGRLDGEKSGDGLTPRMPAAKLIGQNTSGSTVIVLEHEPVELNELAELGVSLVLSGHTHAGQFFPLTLAQPFIWKNPYGLKKFGSMYSVVTSGVGVYGPPLRILTDSEVVQIDLRYGNTGG